MIELAVQLLETPFLEFGGQAISLLWVIQLLLALVTVSIITRFVKSFLKYRLLAGLGIDDGNREAIATLISFGIGAVGYIIVLQATGFNLASLAVIIGGLGVGIGFGLQDITKNLLSGLTILIERKLRVGDFIEFDGIEGYIEEISIRSTVIHTLAGAEVVIPNSQLAEERITNWSYRDFKGRVEVSVGVAYGSDPVLVTETLLDAARALTDVLSEPSPKVIFDGFGDSALNFKLWIWTNRIDRRVIISSDLTFTIEYYLRQRGITIPFPQIDLWVKTPHSLTDSNSRPEVTSSQGNGKESQPTQSQYSTTLRTWLSQISYFQQFNELQLRSLIEMGYRQSLEASDILVRQGEVAREFCIVLSGEIGAFYQSEHHEKHLFTFEAGQYFGELPLMLGVPYPTTMRALSDTMLFMINATGFEKLLQDYPALAEAIAQELSRRREVLQAYHQELQQLGILASDIDNNPIVWIRKRLKQLFTKASTYE
ncbi:MAG: mechanosensitive ion channel [Elainellaceae cyanobacterium]